MMKEVATTQHCVTVPSLSTKTQQPHLKPHPTQNQQEQHLNPAVAVVTVVMQLVLTVIVVMAVELIQQAEKGHQQFCPKMND